MKGLSKTSKKTVKVGIFSLKLGITQLLSKRSYRRYTIGKRRDMDNEDDFDGRTVDSVTQSENKGGLTGED